MAGKYGLGRLHRQRALYGVDFLSEPIITRQNGILDDVDVVAIPYLGPVDTLPPRAVHKAAVDQNDIFHCSLPPLLTRRSSKICPADGKV